MNLVPNYLPSFVLLTTRTGGLEPLVKIFFISALFVCTLTFGTASPRQAFAETADTVEIEGLSFPCPGCRVDTADGCLIRITPSEELILMPCSDALGTLLATATLSERAEYPTVPQLRSFLLGKKPPESQVNAALRLLFRSDAGVAAIIDGIPQLYSKYSSNLTELAKADAIPVSVLESLWKLPTTSGVSINGALKSVIVSKNSALGADDLLDSLPLVDLAADLSELEEMRATLSALGDTDNIAQLAPVIQVLRSCIAPDAPINGCAIPKQSGLSPAVYRYLSRVKVNHAIAAARAETSSPADKLRLVAETDYANFRTPDLHQIVLDAIRSAVTTGFNQDRLQFLTQENRQLLAFFSQNDPAISQAYTQLLIRAADDAIEHNDLLNGIGLLEESFSIDHTNFEPRTSLIHNLRFVGAIAESADLRARRDALESQLSSHNSALPILIGIAVVFGIIGIGLIAIAIKLRTRRLAMEGVIPPSLSITERAQLRELLSTFELAGNATEEELTKAYRAKARELHPDTGAGATEEFTALTERYKTAKDLITLRDRAG